jgi:perosamine synthetase
LTASLIPAAKPLVGAEEAAAVSAVVLSGNLAQGAEVAAFENEFSEIAVASRHSVAVNSGTSALHMALIALGISSGHEVIVPSFTFAATANAVRLVNAVPVFADIDPATFCLDPDSVEAAVTERTRAIMPVHLYGHPADMTRILDIARRHELLVLEDAAQAHLAEWDGRPVGSIGDAGAFSFYPTKNMTSGEGGMVVTGDSEVARTVRLLRNQGMEVRYRNEIVGFNTRMTDVHAAIGRVQLRRLEAWTADRERNAAFLSEHLRGVTVPKTSALARHVFHQYTVRIQGGARDDFAKALAARGVGNGVYYPTPIHRLPSFGLECDLPETEAAAAEVLSLPVHPALSPADLEAIVAGVNAVAEAGV